MGLLERVSTLIRANLNDMIDHAEDPEKMIKQVILDMENQYLQVKTQVAVSIADLHILEKRLRENDDSSRDWMRKAEIIFKKGDAEARAMNVKAAAFQEYNQAAVVDKLISSLPEVVRALSEPLSKVDKVTIVSTGNGDAAGAYKLTGDVTKIAAQVPALFEALSGMEMSELLGKIRLIGDKSPKAIPPAAAPSKS